MEKAARLYLYSYNLLVCVLHPSLPANFTGDPPFHLDDVRRTGESEAPQNSLPALQLVHLQDGLSFLQLSLGRSNICCNLKHTHKHVLLHHATFTWCQLGEALSGFLEKIKSIKCTLITASCFVHEVISDTTLTITVMKWNICVIWQPIFISLLICYPL